jgi:23S rRNA (adenine2030-N6)-methyltransferase
MNYRHSYHAGNFADVFKHSILVLLIEALLQKDKPFCYVDTHAGIGCYDLQAEESQKTQEYLSGIAKVLAAENYPPELETYINICSGNYYPGSPYIVRQMLRPQDRMILMELHKDDAEILKQNFHGDKQIAIHNIDGYLGLKAFLPPKENRGLVLIDPSYEEKDEFDKILNGLKIALKHWRNGIYAIWYPIKDPIAVENFLAQLEAICDKPIYSVSIRRGETMFSPGLNSCGMAIINPPWQLEEKLEKIISWLQTVFTR